ncbi:MAG: septal ring lytic transglycosylase RlpA family protein [Thermodesulfovibrionales bacterium]|nr:septal ring lytic transglycosylase RlpA family protein [Thermodesulfovibrionales bacterium]
MTNLVLLFALSLSLFFITSCATTKKQPPYQPPKKEETREYELEGIKGKRQRLIASWYGADFHGRPTASGEKFNMYNFTCAHKEFPFGTILNVTNPKNNKTTKCTINDRGPFVPGRDIDLSYGTAKDIEIIGMGISPVDIEVLGRDERYIKTVRGQIITGLMTIQIGSFKEEANALRLKAGLDLRYKDVYIMQTMIRGEKYYRVRIGSFKDPQKIESLAKTLALEGYDTLITAYEKP